MWIWNLSPPPPSYQWSSLWQEIPDIVTDFGHPLGAGVRAALFPWTQLGCWARSGTKQNPAGRGVEGWGGY